MVKRKGMPIDLYEKNIKDGRMCDTDLDWLVDRAEGTR